MAQKFIAIAVVVCVLAAFVHAAPQFNNRGAKQFNQQAQFAAQPKPQFQPQDSERQSRFLVVDDNFQQQPNGEYTFDQKFASGETYAEQGSLKRVVNPEDGQEKEVIVTKGSYTIVDKDGSVTLVNYTADETGFHPEIVPQGGK